MNPNAWAPSLNNPYALIGFTLLVLSIVATTPVVRAKFPRAYLICFQGLAAVVIVAMLIALFSKDNANITSKGKPVTLPPIVLIPQSASNSIQITGGSGNTAINNQNAPININIDTSKKP